MAPSQASGHRLWSDPFSALPPEINIQLLEYLHLHDMQSAISCSPLLSRVLASNRQCILKPYLRELQLSYGDISLFHLAAAAMHLRELHSKHEGDTIQVLEKQVKPVLDSISRFNTKTTEERGDINLYMVVAAQVLLPEIIGAFTMGPWNDLLVEFQHRSPGSLWPDMAPLGLRTAFSDGFLRFDCYRSLFYHKDRELFQKRAGIKDAFLNSFPEFPKFDDEILRMYPYMILGKIRHRYGEIMLDLDRKDPDRRLARGLVWPKGAWKKVLATTGIINYRTRTRAQDNYFVFRLALQGYPKLSFFEQLSPETLLSTMEEEFEELVISNLKDCEAWTAHRGLHYHNLVRYFTLWSNKRQEHDSGTCNLM